MPQTVTDPTQSEIDDFAAQQRINQAKVNPPADDDNDLEAFLRNYRAQEAAQSSSAANAESEPISTPIVPFSPPIATQSLDQRAAKLGSSMIPLTPPPTDTTQTPSLRRLADALDTSHQLLSHLLV